MAGELEGCLTHADPLLRETAAQQVYGWKHSKWILKS